MQTGLKEIERAVEILRTGGVIAYPTETYYGLGVDIDNEPALKRLFSVKKRSYDKPLLVLIDSEEKLRGLVSFIPEVYFLLMRNFWPGPLTLLFPVDEKISKFVTGNTGTIGVRISSNTMTRELCRHWGKPLPATSANISGEKAARTAEEVVKQFGSSINFVIQSEKIWGELASTIVSFEHDSLNVIRKGVIQTDAIRAVVGSTLAVVECSG